MSLSAAESEDSRQKQLLISAKSAMSLSKDILLCGEPAPTVTEWGYDNEAHMELIKVWGCRERCVSVNE